VHAVRLQPAEVESWERAAAAMHVPFDDERRIHPQDVRPAHHRRLIVVGVRAEHHRRRDRPRGKAPEYFQYALLMDLGNVAGNVSDGVHIASAAGVWSSLVFGFGGVRDFDGRLSFEPRLPRAWNELAFALRFFGRQLRVKLTHDEERYLVEEGQPLNVLIRGESHLLSPDTPVAIKLPPP
jgi:Glycosyl hydrolase family 65, C-terminal domain